MISPIGTVFRAIAHPTRRRVLALLRTGPQSAGRLALEFPSSRAAISKHIQQLLRANLLVVTQQGRNRLYELNTEPLDRVDNWLGSYRSVQPQVAVGAKKSRKVQKS